MSRTEVSTRVIDPLAHIFCDDCGGDIRELFADTNIEEARRLARNHARQRLHRVNLDVLRRTVYEGEAPGW